VLSSQVRLIIRNSEVGASALRVEPFMLRMVCSDGLILERSLKKLHLGRQTMEVGEIDWSEETRELEDRALWSKVRDIIRATFDKRIFQSWVERLRESTKVEIERPIEAVNNIVGHLGLTEEQKQRLLMHFSEPIKYGLINAITNLARQVKDVEEQIRLEEFGGKDLASEDLRGLPERKAGSEKGRIGRFWSTCEGFKARDEPRTASFKIKRPKGPSCLFGFLF
jgi:hypothetical protein